MTNNDLLSPSSQKVDTLEELNAPDTSKVVAQAWNQLINDI